MSVGCQSKFNKSFRLNQRSSRHFNNKIAKKGFSKNYKMNEATNSEKVEQTNES